jgi:hypothetical protein
VDKSELLNEVRKGRARLEATLAQIREADMTPGRLDNGWSVKDLLAHLAFWERRAGELLNILLRGEVPAPIPDYDVDAINKQAYDESLARPLAEVRQQEQAAYRDLLAMVEAAPDAALFDPKHFAWTENRPFYGWIADNTYGHYEEHSPALDSFVAARRAK